MAAPPTSSSLATRASTGTSPSPPRPPSSWKSCRTPAASPSRARTAYRSIGRRQRSELFRRQPELRCANEAVDLLDGGGARDGSGNAFAGDEPSERHFGGLRFVRGSHGIERRQDAQAAVPRRARGS